MNTQPDQSYFPKDRLQLLATQLVNLVYETKKEKATDFIALLEDPSLSQETLLYVIENLITTIELKEINNEYIRIYNEMLTQLHTAGKDTEVSAVRSKLEKAISDKKTVKS